ncbi:hypothetical protein ABTN03_20440, partial [Acinetobacter baumannii]
QINDNGICVKTNIAAIAPSGIDPDIVGRDIEIGSIRGNARAFDSFTGFEINFITAANSRSG